MKADLHTHTYYSDGTFSPKEVVLLARERGVKILAVTDHNVVTGLDEAIALSTNEIMVIPGIEISSSVSCAEEHVHIVGLNIDHHSRLIAELSQEIVRQKKEEMRERIVLINSYFGSDVTEEEIKTKTRGSLGMPHAAMVLLDKGYVKDIREGIKLFLKGGPLHVGRKEKPIHAKDAIKLIHDAGGLAVLAHLSAYKNEHKFETFEKQEILIKELKSYGLDGLEIFIPDALKEEIDFGKKMASDYGLLISGGSDFHDEKFIPQNILGFLDLTEDEITILKKLVR